MSRIVCAALAVLAGGLGLALAGGFGSVASAAGTSQLQDRIRADQGTVSALAGAVQSASGRLTALDGSISALEHRQAGIEAQLNRDRAQLLSLRAAQSAATTRLKHLEAFEARAETVLSRELVSTYESGSPDLVTVVLDAHGFQDLLDQLGFEERVRKQDVEVVSSVKAARRAVAAEATRLGALAVRQQNLTADVVEQRDRLAQTQANLTHEQIALWRYRGKKAGQLASARGQVAALRTRLARIEAAQAAAAARAAAHARRVAAPGPSSPAPTSAPTSAPAPSGSAPPPRSSVSGFVFPLPIGAAAPPSAWSPDQGVDISAPGNTPEYAVCSGTIVLHGIGGFGPWAPVLHCDSPLDGYSYVYYGHAGPENQLPVGTHVGAGQVMSSIGPGIVGISSGPHLELGFADSSGAPIGASSAQTMLGLLRGAY